MSTTSSIIPHSYLPLLANASAVFSGIPLLIGIGILYRPQTALDILEFPTPADPKDKNLAYGLSRIFGARDLAVGLNVLAVWYYGDHKTLGAVVLLGSILTITDGFVSRQVIGGREWFHWGFMPVNIGLGLGLLQWV